MRWLRSLVPAGIVRNTSSFFFGPGPQFVLPWSSEDEYLAGLLKAGLVDAEIRDRLVYDADQLEGMVASDLESVCSCGAGKAQLVLLARTLAGKVWSAVTSARTGC